MGTDDADNKHNDRKRAYWMANIRIVVTLMSIWFLVAFGCGVFGIEWLNQFKIGNLGLGFWMAQQGSIFVFAVLVIAYAFLMDRLDRKFKVGE